MKTNHYVTTFTVANHPDCFNGVVQKITSCSSLDPTGLNAEKIYRILIDFCVEDANKIYKDFDMKITDQDINVEFVALLYSENGN